MLQRNASRLFKRCYSSINGVNNTIRTTKNLVEADNVSTLNSSYIDFRKSLNSLITESNNHQELIAEFSKYSSKPDTVYIGMLCRAWTLLSMGQFKESMQDLQTLLLIDNQAALKKGGTGYTNERILLLTYHLMYNLLLSSGSKDQKRLDLCIQSIRELDSDFMPGCLDVANYYQNQPDHSGDEIAESHYERALQLCPDNEEALLCRSYFYTRNKHTMNKAVLDCERVLQINPNNMGAQQHLRTLKETDT